MRSPFEIIRTARITEKGTGLNEKGQYVFEVDRKATKQEVREAIKNIFKKTVVSVNTMNVRGKDKKTRYGMGRQTNWKKAIITLKEGEKLDLV